MNHALGMGMSAVNNRYHISSKARSLTVIMIDHARRDIRSETIDDDVDGGTEGSESWSFFAYVTDLVSVLPNHAEREHRSP